MREARGRWSDFERATKLNPQETARTADVGARALDTVPAQTGGPRTATSAIKTLLILVDRKAEYWLSFLFYVYLFSILTVEVVFRSLGHSIVWAVETSLYAFIWLTYISAAQLARGREHLAFTLVRDMLGRNGQFLCLVISDVCLFVVSATIIFYMWQPLTDAIRFQQQMTGADLPIGLALVAVPAGWALVAVRVAQRFARLIGNFRGGRPLSEGDGGGFG